MFSYCIEKMSHQNTVQRINIKFCAKFREIGSETCAVLSEEYGTEAVNKSTVFEWHT
jgi:hypothetical protein